MVLFPIVAGAILIQDKESIRRRSTAENRLFRFDSVEREHTSHVFCGFASYDFFIFKGSSIIAPLHPPIHHCTVDELLWKILVLAEREGFAFSSTLNNKVNLREDGLTFCTFRACSTAS